MSNMYAKELYPRLISIKWPDPYKFLYDAATNSSNIMWGTGGAGREFAREILQKDINWYWISFRIDDFAPLVEENMRNRLSIWIWRSHFGLGALSKRSQNTETIVMWLMDRYVSMLKNIFDTRYKNSLEPSFLVEFDEKYFYTKELL